MTDEQKRRRGPLWGLMMFGLFVWFVLAGGLIRRDGLERLAGAVLLVIWVWVVADMMRRRQQKRRADSAPGPH